MLDTNEMLDKELNRILDIKEETDQHLLKAYHQITELDDYKTKTTILLVLNQIIIILVCISNLITYLNKKS